MFIHTGFQRAAALLLSAACLISFALCGCGENTVPDIRVLENREGETVFSLSAEAFIQRWNTLYHKNGVGLYPYFANGECVHLCIIPVTAEVIGGLAAKGTEIHEI